MKKLLTFIACIGFLLSGFSQITEAEYYIDIDNLGVGNQIALTVTSGNNIDENFTIPTTGLTEGLHVLHIRAKGTNNTWSLYKRAYFYVRTSTTNGTPKNIVAAEYYIDTDNLGVGNQNTLTVTSGMAINEVFTIHTTGLIEGLHVLHIRVKDADDTWSLYKRAYFYTHSSNSNATATPIIAAEYFFDTDPGVGNATSVAVTQGFTIDEDLLIQVPPAMVNGDHYLYLRAQNQDNSWSLYKRALFTVDSALSIEELNSDSFKIFPNPVQDQLTITGKNMIVNEVNIYDHTGRIMKKVIWQGTSTSLNHLAPGMYILRIKTNQGTTARKILKI